MKDRGMSNTELPSKIAGSLSPNKGTLENDRPDGQKSIFCPLKSKIIDNNIVVFSPSINDSPSVLEALFVNNHRASRQLKSILDEQRATITTQQKPSQPPTLGKRQPDLPGLAYYSSRCREISKKHSSNEDLILGHFDKCRSRLQKIAERF